MEPGPPVVGACEVPLQDADLDPRMGGSADVVAQLREVVADASQAGLEVGGLVLVVVTSEDIDVLSGKVDDRLAPDHVVRPLLSACYNPRLWSDGPQPASIDIDDVGVSGAKPLFIGSLSIW